MVGGNPAVLIWINYKAKKIWKKKYSGKDGKYKKAHKEAKAAYRKKCPKKERLVFFWPVVLIIEDALNIGLCHCRQQCGCIRKCW